MSVIAVAQTKGGAGKTTIAICLAGYYASRGLSVHVIDADGPQHHSAKWLDRARSMETPLAPVSVEIVSNPDAVPQAIVDAAGQAQVVIVDIIGALAESLTFSVANADLVVLPFRDSGLDIDGAATTLGVVANVYNRIKREIAFEPVVTQAKPRTQLHAASLKMAAEVGLLPDGYKPSVMEERVAYREGFVLGSTPTFLEPKGAAAQEIEKLGDLLLERFQQIGRPIPKRTAAKPAAKQVVV